MAGQFTQVGIELVVRRMANFTKATTTIRRQMGLTGVQANRLSKNMQGATTKILNFGNGIRNVGNQVLILGFQLSFLASGAMVAFIGKAVEFENSMVKIINLVGVAESRVADWSEELLKLGPTLAISPNELAEALFVITSAGIRDQAEALEVLEQAAKGAAIGLGETKDVARIMTGVLQAYGDANLSAEQAVDILTTTVKEGNLEVEELAPTLGRVIGIASEMGVSFAEVGAFIASFTRVSVPATVAVTSLRSTLNAIIKPTAAAKEKLAEYEISMGDVYEAIADPNIGLHKVLLGLSAVFGDSSEEMAQIIGSARGLAGVLVVTGGLADEYPEIFNSINDSLGTTAEGFDRFTQTTAFQVGKLKATFDALAITVGATLLPGINALLDAVTPLFEGLKQLAELHPKITILVGALGGLVTVLGPLLIISGLIVSSIGTLIIAIGSFVSFVVSIPLTIAAPLAAVVALFAGLAIGVASGLKGAQKELDESGRSLAERAFAWGSNIILSFARGMGAAAAAVTRVLIIIGNHIKDLLQALSPPKLLPDIDIWGRKTMEAWLEGWLDADFSIFNQVADNVESAIRSLTLDSDLWDGFTEQEGITAILTARQELVGLTQQIKETGQVSREALDRIFDPDVVGASSKALKSYVLNLVAVEKATKDLADAQERLNKMEEEFVAILRPINAEIEELEGKRQDILDAREREELLSIIADPNAPAQAKEVAHMRLRHMELLKQKKTVEAQRDAEIAAQEEIVSTAEAALTAEEKKLETTQALIDFQIKQNELAKELVDIFDQQEKGLGSLADAVGDLSDAIGGTDPFGGGDGEKADPGKGGLADRIREFLDPGLFGNLQQEMGDIVKAVEQLVIDSKAAFLEGYGDTTLADELAVVWTDVLTEAAEKVDQGKISEVVGSILKGAISGSLEGILGNIPFLNTISEFLLNIFLPFSDKEEIEKIAEKHGFALGKDYWPSFITSFFEAILGIEFNPDRSLVDTVDSISNNIRELLGLPAVGDTSPQRAETPIWLENWNLLIRSLAGLEEGGDNARESVEELDEAIGGSDGEQGISGTAFDAALAVDGWNTSMTDTATNIDGPVKRKVGGFDGLLRDDLIPHIGTDLNQSLKSSDESFTFWQKNISGPVTKAISDLEEFLGIDFSDTMEDVSDFLDDTFTLSIDTMKEAWENVKTALEGPISTAFNTFKDAILSPFETAIFNLKNKVKELFDNIGWLKGILETLGIPWPFEESSPSPFEQAIRNTMSAMDEMAASSAPGLGAALRGELGTFYASSSGKMMGRTTVGQRHRPAASSTKTVHMNMGGQTINNGMDTAAFSALVEKAMRKAL